MSARRGTLGALCAAALLAATPASADAARVQEATFQDDTLLVYKPPREVARTMIELRALGVDRLRISVYWGLVSPDPQSTTAPDFDATDPAAYPPGAWDRYDTIAILARRLGLKLNFNISTPAPVWATVRPPGDEVRTSYYPSPVRFAQFVVAVGRRYSGSYVPPPLPPEEPDSSSGGELPIGVDVSDSPPAQTAQQQPQGSPLPRVNFWSLFNEPSQSHFLAPQWTSDPRNRLARVESSPRQYRAFVDAGFAALGATGHGADAILIGELAPKGSNARTSTSGIKPLRFIRRLYCVDDDLRPLRGSTAAVHGCPRSNQIAAFRREHPGLFFAYGWGHHPYSLLTAPNVLSRDPDFVAIADYRRLRITLALIFRRYGFRGSLGPRVFYTEYGYQSRPDPFGLPQWLQARYINWAEYIAWRQPGVRSHSQFLLLDSAPFREYSPSNPLFWSSFQSGLKLLSGRRKSAWGAYRLPIHLPLRRRAAPGRFLVWGVLRPAPNGSAQAARIIFRPLSGGPYRTIAIARTNDPYNALLKVVTISRSGLVRIAWTPRGGGRTIYSRPEVVTIG